MPPNNEPVSMRRLLLFFIPMGISALMINLSHVIINGTLARSDNPEMVLAGYALAMSLLIVTEKPAVLFRQTCSALVRDRTSFVPSVASASMCSEHHLRSVRLSLIRLSAIGYSGAPSGRLRP